jgi:hypothetical protein
MSLLNINRMSGQKRKLSLNYFVEPSTALEHPEINSK